MNPAGQCGCAPPDTGHAAARSIDDIHAECLLPLEQRQGREAEFDALFDAAGRNWSRPAATRLRLALDAAVEAWARDLAERETACCAFFTFAFTRRSTDTVQLDVSVPPSHTAVLDALAERAEKIARGGS
jgi:hypothetical protein